MIHKPLGIASFDSFRHLLRKRHEIIWILKFANLANIRRWPVIVVENPSGPDRPGCNHNNHADDRHNI